MRWLPFFIVGGILLSSSCTSYTFFHASHNSEQTWVMNEGDYFTFEVLFRHLLFLNGSRIDTPVSVSGTQNGTLTLSAIESTSEGEVLLEMILNIAHQFHSEKRVWFDTTNQQFRTEDRTVLLGSMHMWLDFSEVESLESFIISSSESIGVNASGTLLGISSIDMKSLGNQEVRMVRTVAFYDNRPFNWTTYYDLDTNIIVRMSGEPADPIILGLHGIKSIDFAVSLIDTNYDIGPPLFQGGQENRGTYQDMSFGSIVVVFVGVGFISTFSYSIYKYRINKRRERRRKLKERRTKMKRKR